MHRFNGASITVPERNTIDALAEAAERKEQHIRAHLPSRQVFIDTVLENLRDELTDQYSALGDLVDRLHDAPIRDDFDARAVKGMRNPQTLGRAMLDLIVMASLEMYDEAMGASGEGAF
jgi:hypothetical protein